MHILIPFGLASRKGKRYKLHQHVIPTESGLQSPAREDRHVGELKVVTGKDHGVHDDDLHVRHAIDMSNVRSPRIEAAPPKTRTACDHFRVTKAMIGKMDRVRRREMTRIDDLPDGRSRDTGSSSCATRRSSTRAGGGSAEGFNTKIRPLTKQSYGILDFK